MTEVQTESTAPASRPSWHFVLSDAITVIAMLGSMAVGWGKMDQRMQAMEARLEQQDKNRAELKNDIRDDLNDLKRLIERTDDRNSTRQQAMWTEILNMMKNKK